MKINENKFCEIGLVDELEKIAKEYRVDLDLVLHWASCFMEDREFYVDMENAEAADEVREIIDDFEERFIGGTDRE